VESKCLPRISSVILEAVSHKDKQAAVSSIQDFINKLQKALDKAKEA